MDRPLVAARKKLVIGASGFLGSHVTRQLVATGADVRVMLRRSSSTKGIDEDSIREAAVLFASRG